MRFYYTYMVTNRWKTVLYTGITSDLNVRVWQHKNKAVPGFTQKYNCDRLVWFAEFTEVNDAIAAEKRIKGWTRAKKNALVDEMNPEWKDLAADWYTETS
jgi:putative endonuclease